MPETTPKHSRKKSAVTGLTETGYLVAEAVLDGKNFTEAAKIAGCTPSNVSTLVRTSKDVKAYLEAHRSELRNAAQIKRGDIIAGIMEAIDVARLAADPSSMIRGWAEIGKMLGLYAAEKKELVVTDAQRRIQNKFEVMSDEELLAYAEGKIIDGECSIVSDNERFTH